MVTGNAAALTAQQIDDIVRDAMGTHPWPGLSVGVVCRGTVLYARGFGVACIDGERPVTPATVFRMGSISKTLTAIGIMQLWEQGRFQLDDPVNGYLSGYRVAHRDPGAPPVTFRHLLTHTAGIGALRGYADLLGLTGKLIVKHGRPVPPLPRYYAPLLRVETFPGSKFAYSNHGFATLGQLIEDISGLPFARYMIERVFDPLGMVHSDFSASERVRDHVAGSHRRRRGRLVAVAPPEIVPGPAGALRSTVDDMCRYLAALLNGGANDHGRVLKPETLRLMMTPQLQRDQRVPTMGLGFILDEMGARDGHQMAGHSGEIPWFTASLRLAPDDGVGVIAAINRYDPNLRGLTMRLLSALVGLDDEPSRLPRPDVPESPQLWPTLCGSYGPSKGPLTNLRFWGNWRGEARVAVESDHLAMRALLPPRRSLRLYPADLADPLYFYTAIQDRIIPVLFQQGSDGRIDGVQIGLMFALYRRSGLQSLRNRARLLALALSTAAMLPIMVTRPLRKRKGRNVIGRR